MKYSKQQLLAGVVTALVAIVVVAGIIVVGSPSAERTRRLDDQRIEDLRNISYAVESYYQNEGTLPPSLETAARQPNAYVPRIADPATGDTYEYLPSATAAYELCATFDAPTDRTDARSAPPELSFWNHDAGRICYGLEARVAPGSIKPAPLQ